MTVNNTLNYYNQNAQSFADSTLNVEFSEMQDAFLSLIPTGGYILDFGCGSGRDDLHEPRPVLQTQQRRHQCDKKTNERRPDKLLQKYIIDYHEEVSLS